MEPDEFPSQATTSAAKLNVQSSSSSSLVFGPLASPFNVQSSKFEVQSSSHSPVLLVPLVPWSLVFWSFSPVRCSKFRVQSSSHRLNCNTPAGGALTPNQRPALDAGSPLGLHSG